MHERVWYALLGAVVGALLSAVVTSVGWNLAEKERSRDTERRMEQSMAKLERTMERRLSIIETEMSNVKRLLNAMQYSNRYDRRGYQLPHGRQGPPP